MLGGDDVSIGPQQSIAEYDDSLTTVNGTTITVSNIDTGLTEGQRLVFEQAVIPIPAAAWLFGSALGLLGWLAAAQAKKLLT